MRTFVRMIFHSEGADPLEVRRTMREMGFDESLGMHDFVFPWKEPAPLEEVLTLVSRMHRALKGLNVQYEITTVV